MGFFDFFTKKSIFDDDDSDEYSPRFPGIDWYCDHCNDCLNYQDGFNDHKYIWKCTECGYKNSISSDNILEDEDNDILDVYDAALIWQSNGKDEDYMFGYSEEELEEALED